MIRRIVLVVLAAALTGACATTYTEQTDAVLAAIGHGLGNVEVLVPPTEAYTRNDGAQCEAYQVREFNPRGHVRYGTATVCRHPGGRWILTEYGYQPWTPSHPPAPHPMPPATGPSYPVPNPAYPVPGPSHPGPSHPGPSHPAPQPPPGAGGPGQWVPVTR